MKIWLFMLAIALSFASCTQTYQAPELPYCPTCVLVTQPTSAPVAPSDAHGCTNEDWRAAERYRFDSEEAAGEDVDALKANADESARRLKGLAALDDRRDLEAKIKRHDLQSATGRALFDRETARSDRENAASALNTISPLCRDWLMK